MQISSDIDPAEVIQIHWSWRFFT